jgi:hypothetical protein
MINYKHILFFILLTANSVISQNAIVEPPSGVWTSLIKLANFDPLDDQQSVSDTDFVGNASIAIMETQKSTITFSDDVTDEVYYFRVRMGESNPNTSFYFGIDVNGDLIADLFIEANSKAKPNFVSFHTRDYSKSGISPSQTAWLNGSQNNELLLTDRNAEIRDYSAGTDLDGGNSGVDYWIEFGFTEESIKSYVLDNFGISITGDSLIAMFGFTSTSQTSNGDVLGVNDSVSGELDKTWEELGVIINGSLNNIASGKIVTPTVNQLSTEDTTPTISGTWGGVMLGDDSLSITINGITYTKANGLNINGLNWSLTLTEEIDYGTWDVSALVYRQSNSSTAEDTTQNELTIIPPTIEEDTTVSSGNDGGLESNGDLARLIAKRNFNRVKTNNQLNKKEKQLKYSKKGVQRKLNNEIDLSTLFPEFGITGKETSHISTPSDLLNITNAKQIFSVDYYDEGTKRIAAVLATETEEKVYDHSKIICDRLNKSSLVDATVFTIRNHQIIMHTIERENGLIEYAFNFSIQLLTDENILHSYWNIEQFPQGNTYLNFQIWGSSFDQINFISNEIFSNLSNSLTSPINSISLSKEERIPSVYVKNGYYKNGQLNLIVKNNSESSFIDFEGNIRNTEKSNVENQSDTKFLNSDIEELVTIETGNLFDIGFKVKGENSILHDALYLADGPWGIDYLESETNITAFDISNNSQDYTDETYSVERNVAVSGDVFGTANLFRNILPGDLVFEVTNYEILDFRIENSLPVEVILVTDNLDNWDNRLRYQLQPNLNEVQASINLNDFKDQNGNSADISKIRGVVFSVRGDYSTFQPFILKVSELSFTNAKTLSLNDFENTLEASVYNYPNPFKNSTTIVLPQNSQNTIVMISDFLGRIIYNEEFKISLSNKIKLNLPNLQPGVYKLITLTNNQKMQTNIVVE